jgi:hypothetical protein
MLFREKAVAVYCENHMKDTGPLCGKAAELLGGTYSNHYA